MPTEQQQAARIPAAVVVVCLLASAAAYVWQLDRRPVYLGGDEAHFGVHGHAIAQDGRNLDGMRLPLFINLWDPAADQRPRDLHTRWYQPMLFYIVAFELLFLPLTEFTLRLPTALIAGLIVPWLTYAVGLRLFRSPALAGVAALIMATSPTMLILGRQALDYVLPLPFVLGWLWALLWYRDSGRHRAAVLAGLLLGLGFYSYIASWIFMPMCLGLSWFVAWQSRHPGRLRAGALMTAAFAVPLLPMLPWFIAHPEMLRDTFSRYLDERSAAEIWKQRAVTYVSLFDPRVLFVRGGPVPTTSLGRSGALLLPVAVLIPAGLYVLFSDRRFKPAAPILLAGLFIAPIPAAFAAEAGMIQRVLPLLLFAAFIAAAGVAVLWQLPRAIGRLGIAAVVAACIVQFGYVYYDYFGHYVLRSVFYYDSVAFVHVAEDLFADRDLPAVYLSRDLDDSGSKWRFYTIKHHRGDLLAKTHYIDPGEAIALDAPPGSVFVTYPDERHIEAVRASGRWRMRKQILDADNRPASMIFERLAQ